MPRFLEESLKTDGFHQPKRYIPLNASWACPEDYLLEKFNSTENYKSKAAQVETSPSRGYGIYSLKIGADGKVKEVNFYRIPS